MQIRKDVLENDHYYHIFSRSIAGYTIFNDPEDYSRIYESLNLYRYAGFNYKYSAFCDLTAIAQAGILASLKTEKDFLVKIIAFCIMPTHIHLILEQEKDHGISKFMARVLNGYSKYFNIKHRRSGPLWSGRFKNVLVKNDEQLLHLTRYLHLNPTSAGLVQNPEEWIYSSYNEYIGDRSGIGMIDRSGLFDLDPKTYKKFVLDQKAYQRQISLIKSLLIEDYSG